VCCRRISDIRTKDKKGTQWIKRAERKKRSTKKITLIATPAILTDIFRGFPHHHPANIGILSRLGQMADFQINSHATVILQFNVILSELPMAS
jgi:hypothetical protein